MKRINEELFFVLTYYEFHHGIIEAFEKFPKILNEKILYSYDVISIGTVDIFIKEDNFDFVLFYIDQVDKDLSDRLREEYSNEKR